MAKEDGIPVADSITQQLYYELVYIYLVFLLYY